MAFYQIWNENSNTISIKKSTRTNSNWFDRRKNAKQGPQAKNNNMRNDKRPKTNTPRKQMRKQILDIPYEA